MSTLYVFNIILSDADRFSLIFKNVQHDLIVDSVLKLNIDWFGFLFCFSLRPFFPHLNVVASECYEWPNRNCLLELTNTWCDAIDNNEITRNEKKKKPKKHRSTQHLKRNYLIISFHVDEYRFGGINYQIQWIFV